MRLALRGKPGTPFRVPRGIELMPIDAKTGQRGIYGEEGVILEAFKPGDEPPSAFTVIGEDIGGTLATGDGLVLEPEQAPGQDGLTTGTGGLY
jgi:penicillin-binding protein 1A